MARKKKVKISRFEKFFYTLTIILTISSPVVLVFFKSTLSKVNYEVEKLKNEIKTQEKENESLQMKINELASLENIQKVIQDEGLFYDNDSIKNID